MRQKTRREREVTPALQERQRSQASVAERLQQQLAWAE
jgi:hypothetical protein